MSELSITEYELVLHGMDIPQDTPLAWLHRNACFQDTFVHLIAKKAKNT
jgi:hypothetical protein